MPRALVLAALLALPQAALAQEPFADARQSEAAALVNALYAETAWRLASGEPPITAVSSDLGRYFSAPVAYGWPAEGVGFDPITNGQDAQITNVGVGPVSGGPGQAVHVTATFDNFGAPQRLTYVLNERPAGGPMAIEDIIADDWRLSDLLR